MHREVLLRAWPRYPRPIWVLMAACNYALWYSFHAWRQVWKTWRKRKSGLRGKLPLARARQLLDLFGLAYLHGIPPMFYYLYRLYRLPESRWLGYIYTHELPQWHTVMSSGSSARSGFLLAHKHEFAMAAAGLGLPAVETLAVIPQGGSVPVSSLFGGRALFLKPESGSRKDGCLALHYDDAAGTYRLEGAEGVEGKEGILRHLETQVRRRDYLLQPLLRNHPLLQERCDNGSLITIRLITVRGKRRIRALCALLEVPVAEGKWNTVHALPIDMGSGGIPAGEEEFPEMPASERELRRRLEGIPLPLWGELVQTAETAHSLFPDFYTLGWDLAITDQGVKLLEGNINWGVAAHQRMNAPLIPRLMGEETDEDACHPELMINTLP